MEMHRLHKQLVPLGTDPHHQTISVDCKNVMNVVGRYKRDPVEAMESLLEEWADHGFVILPVVNGEMHCAKQATLGHIAKREINHAKAGERRHLLCAVTKSLTQDKLTVDQRAGSYYAAHD